MELLNLRGRIVSTCCLLAGAWSVGCASIPSGDELSGNVKSLDVYGDDGKIHLLLATAKEGQENAVLVYTCSADHGKSWEPYHPIDTSSAPAYARGRGTDFQVAASGKGALAVWMQHGTGFMGRGPLASAFSADGGKSWRNAGNPSDDESIGDHAFIDLTADDKGNFHAVWLDKRSGNDKGLYSASYDARTHRWEKNRTVDGMVCDCCWNVLKADRTGRLHALYRDKTPRDMGWAFSGDYGKTWELGGPVGNFDWRIEACVHVGGGLAIEEKGGNTQLHAVVWTGNQGNAGLYYLSRKSEEGNWGEPVRIGGVECTLPDIAVSDSGQIAIAWIRQTSDGNKLFRLKGDRIRPDSIKAVQVQTEEVYPTHPKLISLGDSLHLFWTGQAGGKEVWRHVKI